MLHISMNARRAASSCGKQQIKLSSFSPDSSHHQDRDVKRLAANVNPEGILDVINYYDRPGGAYAEGAYANADTYAYAFTNKPRQLIPKAGAVAEAGVGRAGAEWSFFEAEAKGPNASAAAQANVLGASAMARSEVGNASASAGPLKLTAGLGVDTGVRAGADGVEVKFLGTGIKVGQTGFGVSVLGSEIVITRHGDRLGTRARGVASSTPGTGADGSGGVAAASSGGGSGGTATRTDLVTERAASHTGNGNWIRTGGISHAGNGNRLGGLRDYHRHWWGDPAGTHRYRIFSTVLKVHMNYGEIAFALEHPLSDVRQVLCLHSAYSRLALQAAPPCSVGQDGQTLDAYLRSHRHQNKQVPAFSGNNEMPVYPQHQGICYLWFGGAET
ncbi:hypothetical protein P4O66_001504 [Electrophorus voltai]|uniref:Uncharacterized protein n=1 Tax=Electrophorus voltai TaxID=2609070 RepID=A0AAD9DUL5_9TELE|nr:hypothetical protein P4O66_001504 [Electrophorus voltai]